MRTTMRFGGIVAVAVLLAGCEPSVPVAPVGLIDGPNLAAGGVAQPGGSCYGVQGNIQADATPTSAFGLVSGDIEGEITTVLGPDPVGNAGKFVTGRVIHLRGEQTVEVSGGSIPDLIGETIRWSLESTVVDQPPIRRVSNRLRLIEGASGNLISHGVLDLITLRSDFDYQGVICLP